LRKVWKGLSSQERESGVGFGLAFWLQVSKCPFSLLTVNAAARLPLALTPGRRIFLIGNTLFDRVCDDVQFKTLLYQG
jgi:hypothetical protein